MMVRKFNVYGVHRGDRSYKHTIKLSVNGKGAQYEFTEQEVLDYPHTYGFEITRVVELIERRIEMKRTIV